jgi:hypothetical protein
MPLSRFPVGVAVLVLAACAVPAARSAPELESPERAVATPAVTATPAGEERSGLETRPGAVPVTFTPGYAAKATEVFSARGLRFLFEVREAFPAGTDEPVPAHEVLERLERIHPGFLAWAAALQARR